MDLQVKLREGRLLASSDNEQSTPVVVINQTMASHFFGTQSPIGQRIRPGGSTAPPERLRRLNYLSKSDFVLLPKDPFG